MHFQCTLQFYLNMWKYQGANFDCALELIVSLMCLKGILIVMWSYTLLPHLKAYVPRFHRSI